MQDAERWGADMYMGAPYIGSEVGVPHGHLLDLQGGGTDLLLNTTVCAGSRRMGVRDRMFWSGCKEADLMALCIDRERIFDIIIVVITR